MTHQRTVVLVGATSGLGREAAKQLAADGHRLVLVGRDPDRAAALGRELPAATVIAADVSVREGVELAAKEISAVTDRVDVLVNNAGVMTRSRQTTAEGIELNLAVHHLAPWSMTALLLPLMSSGSRVVNVNSEGHRAPMRGAGPVRLDLTDLNSSRDFDPFMTYSRTKLANLLFSYELQRRRPDLAVAALHPGVVRTDLGRQWPKLQVAAMHALTMSLSPQRGAEPVVRLAVGPDFTAGGYYDRFTPVRSSRTSYDEELASGLWSATERLRGCFPG
jgi:NAD(P)-dependent dehydrogenase (short-subunit alcohol dehydrogenase family)